MGGRRAADLSRIVGNAKPVSAAKRQLTSAVKNQDAHAIADASANVVAKSQVGLKGLRYGLKLTPYISKNRTKLAEQSASERNESIRFAWSSIKSKENLRSSPEIDTAVVSAAAAAFRKRK